jgi:hypothetical protein
MLSLVGVKNCRLVGPLEYDPFSVKTRTIDRANVLIPEVLIEDFGQDITTTMRPVLDALWQSSNYPKDIYYDDDGKWAIR